MVNSLKGKSAVITGGGRGQGREIAIAMAREGVKVVVNDLGGEMDGTGSNSSPADDVVAEINKVGGTAIANYSDVSDFLAAKDIIDTCIDNFGKIDILVNCAGIIGKGQRRFWEVKKEDWDRVIAVNLNGTFNTCRHALAAMVKQKAGRIINFSSPSWLGNEANAYTASKGAIVSLTLGIAGQMDLEGYQITCNAIVPSAETRMSPRNAAGRFEQMYKAGLITRQLFEESTAPAGPEHIPPIVLYLATDEAAYINGQVIGASRGRVALYSWPKEIKTLYKEGVWTLDELIEHFPITLAPSLLRARG